MSGVEPSFPNPVVMKFDPLVSKDEEIRQVFADPLARTIWIAFRPRHIVSQYFAGEVLEIARRLRSTDPIDNPEDLNTFLRFDYPHHFGTHGDYQWCIEVMPYIKAAMRPGNDVDGSDDLLKYVVKL